LVVGDGPNANAFGDEVVRYMGNDQIADSGGSTGGKVTINPTALFDLNGFSDVVEAIVFNGGTSPNIVTGAGVLTVNGGMTVTPFAGVVTPVMAAASAQINGNLAIGSGSQPFVINHNAALTNDLIISGVVSGVATGTMNMMGTSEVQTIVLAG